MTRPLVIDQQKTSDELWEMASQWVSENQKLIRQIASPYRRYMAAENTDLLQEAMLAAFKALLAIQKKDSPKQFAPFFRVIFKTNCIKLSSGIHAEYCFEIQNIAVPNQVEESKESDNREAIEKALKTVSKRQREICVWLLEQPEPASTPDLAREFNISRRHACRLVSNSVKRLATGSP